MPGKPAKSDLSLSGLQGQSGVSADQKEWRQNDCPTRGGEAQKTGEFYAW